MRCRLAVTENFLCGLWLSHKGLILTFEVLYNQYIDNNKYKLFGGLYEGWQTTTLFFHSSNFVVSQTHDIFFANVLLHFLLFSYHFLSKKSVLLGGLTTKHGIINWSKLKYDKKYKVILKLFRYLLPIYRVYLWSVSQTLYCYWSIWHWIVFLKLALRRHACFKVVELKW